MYVTNPTTPASIFHLLRRQIHSANRKPLIVMTPKSLLRHKLAVSSLSDMGEGTQFMEVIDDTLVTSNAQRIVLCSGKIYYDLFEHRKNDDKVALIRLEQLYPFPTALLESIFQKHPNAQVVWCQEEPQNMGAWTHVYFALKDMGVEPTYIGRAAAASPATGYTSVHQAEQSAIINTALNHTKDLR